MHNRLRLSRFALAALAVALAGCALAGCSSAASTNEAVVATCVDTCDVQLAACPGFDHESCASVCDAYGITVDTQACVDLFEAWKTCEQMQTYMCFEEFAFPEDTDACAAESDAYDAGC